jgi:chromosome partitioning protein
LVDADPQASAADWLDHAEDEYFERVELVEAPTERLLVKALAGIGRDDIAVVDTPPGPGRVELGQDRSNAANGRVPETNAGS